MNVIKQIIARIKWHKRKAKILKVGIERDLYETFFGDFFWLSKSSKAWVDKCIREKSIFEEDSTNFVKKIVKEGDVVLDIGANIGYYSVIMSKQVGDSGKVLCFEPTNYYGKTLQKNIDINNLNNVEIYAFGLSNAKQELSIDIGDSSATLHNPNKKKVRFTEMIELHRLDEVIETLNIKKIDFIKIDIDGHEPAFLEGAIEIINKYKPIILLEVNHLNYLEYGISAGEFYDCLINYGFHIYSEKKIQEYESKTDFLIECGNFSYSANIIITLDKKLIQNKNT